MRPLLIVTLLLVVSGLSHASSSANAFVGGHSELQTQSQFRLVRKIHVGNMGETNEAERFRLLLEEELAKKGFTIVDAPEKADAVLTGVLSVRVLDKKTQARVYVKLITAGGERLWGRDFGSRATVFNRTEPVKLRAQDVAKGLWADWQKSS